MNHLDDLKQEFKKIDIKNPEHLFQWFSVHRYLSVNDHAQIANCSIQLILKWKKSVGFKSRSKFIEPPQFITKTDIDIEVPDNWDSKEWLEQHINRYNMCELARAIGVKRLVIRNRLIKYNIPYRSSTEIVRSHNECNNYDWCYHHYVTLGLNQTQCANKAGVQEQTFATWLNNHKIKVRSLHESRINIDILPWVRRLYYSLKQQSIVRKIRLEKDCIFVRYRSRLYDVFYYNLETFKKRHFTFNVTKEIAKIKKIPRINYEYENELDEIGQYYFHTGLNRKEWNQANLIEKRLAYHEFIMNNYSWNWSWPKYPIRILNQDLEALSNLDETIYITDNAFACPRPSINRHGRRIMLHYFTGPEIISYTFQKLYHVRQLTNFLIRRIGSRINTENLIKSAFWMRKIHIADPTLYTLLLKRLKVKGLVLDLNPGYGSRAIACAINGLRYGTFPNKPFQKALDQDFVNFIGLNYESFIGQKISLLLCDFEGDAPKFQLIMEYMKIAFRTVIFVSKQYYETIYNVYKPDVIIKVKMKFNIDYDYWFIYEGQR